ncbi:GNAT family N-acetyltransferase [Staphylococcus sp. SQ8-PEA]|uniref:GNAT family N-acetyltransferase n=1 Tax=Staphylococcus marylandisciuri TaxID=2981529 RepID=A0ABT2QRR5_9STAP|nr:GNAT family N-acetyltransferase [Staphylococcus marylandisciuri]MCU5746671.1 GNAT family N-acetyltransferase [Staphylococcus marylandisciuri]
MAEFRELTLSDEERYCKYIKEWIDNDELIIPRVTDIVKYENFEDLVKSLKDNKSHDKSIDNTTYFLFVEGEIVGAANIRHELNHNLKQVGGHVGYGVRRSYRGKGYGSKILRKALDYLSRIDVKKALVTCEKTNTSSAKVIEKNGGEEIDPSVLDDGTEIRRFLIEIA